jgi:hypothetical protein
MAWEAINMIPIDQFEADSGIRITDRLHPPTEAPQEALAERSG